MSNFLDLILKHLTKRVKSNIKDNIEFLTACKPNVTDDTVLVDFYVCSLYTNIPHEFGLRAIEYASNYRPMFATQFISEASSYEMLYLQMKGTAISTTFFPTYITLSVGYHEICNNQKQAHLSSL